jgi:hypothetical protein
MTPRPEPALGTAALGVDVDVVTKVFSLAVGATALVLATVQLLAALRRVHVSGTFPSPFVSDSSGRAPNVAMAVWMGLIRVRALAIGVLS